jgi:hypothetical protein
MTVATNQPSRDELARLLALADQLAQETRKLGGETADTLVKLGKTGRTNRHLIWSLAASLALDVLLTLGLGLGFVQINNNQDDINKITARLDTAQTVQRQKALCPLYQLFKDSWDTPAKKEAARKASTDPEAFDHAVKVIDEGFVALDCKDFGHK